jgi:hypothetical protein
MNTGRFATPGKTRSCPHCKATILDSATVCPGCQHHLRFDSTTQRVQAALTPLRVEGTLRHPANGGTWEYSVVLTIRDRRGQEIARQVVGVGALQPGDERAFTLAVEVFKPAEMREPKPQTEVTPPAPEARVPGRPPPVPSRAPAAATGPRFTPASPPAALASGASVLGAPRSGPPAVSGPPGATRPSMAPSGTTPRSTTTSAWGVPPRSPVPAAPSRDGNRVSVSPSNAVRDAAPRAETEGSAQHRIKDQRLASSEPKPHPKRP